MIPLPRAAVWLTWTAVVCFLTISGNLLDVNGWAYSLAGGSVFFKVHPGTYCLLAAFAVLLAQANPVRVIGRIARETPSHVVFLTLVLTLTGYVLARFGTSGSAFLLDLHVAPVVMAILLSRFPPRQASRLLLVAMGLLTLNAAIGIGEYVMGARITPYVVDGRLVQELYFRPTALLGHPLQNALAMATALMITAALTRHRTFALFAAVMMTASLLPFGGRSAVAVAFVLTVVALPIWVTRTIARSPLTYRQVTGWSLAVLVMLSGAAGGLVAFGTRTRILSGFRWDASANTRLLGLQILSTVSPIDLLFGIGPVEIRRRTDILGSYHGIIGLENSWLLLLLLFGFLGLMLFAAGLLTWLWTVLRGAPAAAWLATLTYLTVASTNNTLASKDTTLVLLIILIYGVRGYTAYGNVFRGRYSTLHQLQPS